MISVYFFWGKNDLKKKPSDRILMLKDYGFGAFDSQHTNHCAKRRK